MNQVDYFIDLIYRIYSVVLLIMIFVELTKLNDKLKK